LTVVYYAEQTVVSRDKPGERSHHGDRQMEKSRVPKRHLKTSCLFAMSSQEEIAVSMHIVKRSIRIQGLQLIKSRLNLFQA
jgi:hypothetical protein